MKHILLFTFALLLAFPVAAQEAGDAAKRLELAGKMHDIWPIRTRMESAIDSVSESFPEEKRAQIKAAMRKSIKYDELEEESTKAMADIFTVDELNAMIAFYGSEAGRSVSAKTGDYEKAITPVLTKMLDKAMLDIRTGQNQ